MWTYPEIFDVVVIGAGHAGCEAAHAAATMGAHTLLLTMSLDTIAKMSCNPAIGGTAKGHIVREIDALGGVMGKVADETGIQFRMLNASKGPAVWSPRAQSDKHAYAASMKRRLESIPNLNIKEGMVVSLQVNGGRIDGVTTQNGTAYRGKTVILTTGTFMRGLIHQGKSSFPGGRAGDAPAVGLSTSLENLGFKLGRLKTGTPPRIHKRSINTAELEEQHGESGIQFSYDKRETPPLKQVCCYITYSTPRTKQVVQDNLSLSSIYSGQIQSVGPRYCPSIEDKIVRFADKERHQFFLEPEGLHTDEVYISGLSSAMPPEVQLHIVRSIQGLEKAEIMRPAYAIEYDFVSSGQIHPTFETKHVERLYLAGQINGTTGYEEAAGQGLLAGINAVAANAGKAPLLLKRSEAYLGVMVDELTTKEITEPYRMFTSRAEHRLLLRQDNADLRLREYGYRCGLITEEQYSRLRQKQDNIKEGLIHLKTTFKPINEKSVSLAKALCQQSTTYHTLLRDYPDLVKDYGEDANYQLELTCKYAGYLDRQQKEVAKLQHIENIHIPKGFDFKRVKGLRNEAKEKLAHYTPYTVGQAARISGVSPADITILMVAVQ